MKNKFLKSVFSAVIALSAFLCFFCLFGCSENKLIKLDAPTDIVLDDYDFLSWSSVPDAVGYIVDINGTEYETEDNKLDIFEITKYPEIYKIKVCAYGDLSLYIDSDWSQEITYSVFDYYGNQSLYDDAENNNYSAYKIVLPEKVDGNTVIGISDRRYAGNDKITGIVIPDTVLGIGREAFKGCSSLKRIKLPAMLNQLGTGVFADCSDLDYVDIPIGVRAIPLNTFYNCSSLKTIDFDEYSISRIDNAAFKNCTSLKEMVLPNPVTRLDSNVFENCTSLEYLRINSNLQNFIGITFAGCALSKISVDENNPYFLGSGNCVVRRSDNTLVLGGSDIVIPENTEIIALGSFTRRKNLKRVHVPASVKQLEGVFSACRNIESLSVSEDNEVYISEGNCIVRKDDGMLVTGCKNSVIPDYVKSIDRNVFNSVEIARISLPQGITDIGIAAFVNSGLESIALPSGLKKIGYNAFKNTPIPSVTLPQSVTEMENEAFYGVSVYAPHSDWQDGWVKGEIGNNLNTIGPAIYLSGVFYGCELKSDNGYPYVDYFIWNDNYKAYGGYFLSPEQKELIDSICNNPRVPYREGYEFKGWATEEGGEPVYLPYATESGEIAAFSKAERDATPYGTTLYAVWVAKASA